MESNNGNYIPENLEDGTSLTGEEELKRKSEKSVKEPDKKKSQKIQKGGYRLPWVEVPGKLGVGSVEGDPQQLPM